VVQVRLCTASVRSGFVAPAGCVILGADYCQMEFRLMAHFSGDKSLLQVGSVNAPVWGSIVCCILSHFTCRASSL
jgi:hypothetical protein